MARTRNYRSIGVKLPLAYDNNFGPYGMFTKSVNAIKQNFKNLVLTNPGERVMNGAIYKQTAIYLPFVQILDVETQFAGYKLILKIKYFIPDLGIVDSLDLNIEDESIGT